jgi:AraC-like DNA-binding protein
MKKKKQIIPSHGILIESHAHEAGFQTKRHKHKYHSLLYIVSGQGECKTDNKIFNLSANNAIILKAGQAHQLTDTPDKPMTIFVIYFDQSAAGINDKLLLPLLKTEKKISVPAYSTPRIRRLLRKMLHEQEGKPLLFRESMQQCLSTILLDLYRIQSAAEKNQITETPRKSEIKTKDVLEYIANNLYEHHTLAGASRMAKISQRQFTTLCRKITGKSFNQYINQLRTARAAELLKNSNMSVAAIAFEVGYEDLSTFYRAFKRIYHSSPLAFHT